ncbi:hypothetical protein E2C01_023117 [Portunus trituberculatus]|uniref:Uncharacterized protein n=1 Tax=Portunus trituberculatus TaxID=210409 RepID=A0A5B7EAP5_PORTR|nr:hypothetical protein [Portunus trituberculatus]
MDEVDQQTLDVGAILETPQASLINIAFIPLRGKTPYLFLPTTPSPATANVLAESPSVVVLVPFTVTVTCSLFSLMLQSILLCWDIPEVLGLGMSNEGQESLDVHSSAVIGPGIFKTIGNFLSGNSAQTEILTGMRFPLRYTFTPLVEAAISYALRDRRATMSSSKDSILNFLRSGENVTLIKAIGLGTTFPTDLNYE